MYGYLKTEKALTDWMRSSLRKIWSKHPVRLHLIAKRRQKQVIANKLVFALLCEHCKKWHKLADNEVNHKNACGSFSLLKGLGQWVEHLLLVTEADLEILCKPCHGIVTNSERKGISLEDSKLDKQAIVFGNLTAAEQKVVLNDCGIILLKSNALQRRAAYYNYLKQKRDGL